MPARAIAAELSERVGQEIGVSSWIEVSQQRVDQFAHATLDHQFIHVDPERAKDGPFVATIAHGFLTLSLLSRMAHEAQPPIENAELAVNHRPRAATLGSVPGHYPPPFALRFDYSYDGTMRAFEDSLQRLGLERMEICFIHDIDVFTPGAEQPELLARQWAAAGTRWSNSGARGWSRRSG